MRTKIPAIALSALTIVGVSAAAYADSTGHVGRAVGLRVNETGSDEAAKFKGSVTLAYRTARRQPVKMDTYHWGGNMCPGRNLSEINTEMLADAVGNGKRIVRPYFKPGNGGAKCLVGFQIMTYQLARNEPPIGPRPEDGVTPTQPR